MKTIIIFFLLIFVSSCKHITYDGVIVDRFTEIDTAKVDTTYYLVTMHKKYGKYDLQCSKEVYYRIPNGDEMYVERFY